jgi:hypothetical protein
MALIGDRDCWVPVSDCWVPGTITITVNFPVRLISAGDISVKII